MPPSFSGDTMKKLLAVFLALTLCVFGLTACSDAETTSDQDANQTTAAQQTTENNETEGTTVTSSENNPIVTITMANGGVIEIELYPDVAPNTVNNFISLVEDGFYDGLIFHRVIPDFMIQGGDPEGMGYGGPGYSIAGEFSDNGFENNLAHTRGVISMARSSAPDSAGSQFFIMVDDAPHLDGQYAAFGMVISGMDVVDEIVGVDTNASDKPYEDQVMQTVTVDTKGVDYPEPVTLAE